MSMRQANAPPWKLPVPAAVRPDDQAAARQRLTARKECLMNYLERRAECAEAAVMIRWASSALNSTERYALSAWVNEVPQRDAAQLCPVPITRGGIHMAQKSGLKKLRRRLQSLGFYSSAELLG
jgi:hypothetical protein